MNNQMIFYIVMAIVLLFILSSNMYEGFANVTFDVNEFNNILSLLKPHIEEVINNYKNVVGESSINDIVRIYKDSQTKTIEERNTYYTNALRDFQTKYPNIDTKGIYWELRGLLTDDDLELQKTVSQFIIASLLIDKIKSENILPTSITTKLENKVPREMVLYFVRGYDINKKELSVNFDDFNKKLETNPMFLE
jgi:hypothetical protein